MRGSIPQQRARNARGIYAATIFAFAVSAHAIPIEGHFTGTVTSISPGPGGFGTLPPPSTVSIGDPVTVRFIYESATLPTFSTSTSAVYRPVAPSSEFTVEIESLRWTTTNPEIAVRSNSPNGPLFESAFILNPITSSPSFSSFPNSHLSGTGRAMWWSAQAFTPSPNSLMNSTALPTSSAAVQLSQATSINGGISATAPGAGLLTTGWILGYSTNVSSLQIEPVSAPPLPPVRPPTNFGLFIGVQDRGVSSTTPDLRGDVAATRLAEAFRSIPNSVALRITANAINGEGITPAEVRSSVEAIRTQIRPGDQLFVYIAAHGSSVGTLLGGGVGDEFVQLGRGNAYRLSDDELTDILMPLSDVNKWTFIDACYSGGFWGPGDALEGSLPLLADSGDLNRLTRSGLIAAASESGLAYYGDDGIPILANALFEAWSRGASGFYLADEDANNAVSFPELVRFVENWPGLVGYLGTIVTEMEFGDRVTFTRDLWDARGFGTASFDGALQVGAAVIPEPSTAVMLCIALFLLVLRHRFSAMR